MKIHTSGAVIAEVTRERRLAAHDSAHDAAHGVQQRRRRCSTVARKLCTVHDVSDQ